MGGGEAGLRAQLTIYERGARKKHNSHQKTQTTKLPRLHCTLQTTLFLCAALFGVVTCKRACFHLRRVALCTGNCRGFFTRNPPPRRAKRGGRERASTRVSRCFCVGGTRIYYRVEYYENIYWCALRTHARCEVRTRAYGAVAENRLAWRQRQPTAIAPDNQQPTHARAKRNEASAASVGICGNSLYAAAASVLIFGEIDGWDAESERKICTDTRDAERKWHKWHWWSKL